MSENTPAKTQDVAPWLTVAEQNKHAAEVAKANIKVAKVKARADVKIAKVESDNYTIFKVVCIIALLLMATIGGCTYSETRPNDPVQLEKNQEEYELCMEIEKKHDECQYIID